MYGVISKFIAKFHSLSTAILLYIPAKYLPFVIRISKYGFLKKLLVAPRAGHLILL